MPKTLTRRSLVQGATVGTLAASLGTPLSAQDASPVASPTSGPITIYQARKIITLHDVQSEATHVAVQDGRVLGAGSLEDLSGWGEYVLDDSLKDLVIVPGFIEGHSHVFEAYAAFLTYVGYYDRPAIDGSTLHGVTSYDDLIARLKETDAAIEDPDEPVVAFGWDSIYFEGQEPVSKTLLDQVSTTRQIAIWTASEHSLLVNSAVLEANDITRDTTTPGVVRDENGDVSGILNDPPAMGLAESIYNPLTSNAMRPETIQALGQFALNAGCTTVADMASLMLNAPGGREAWRETVNAPEYPVRIASYIAPSFPGSPITPETIVETIQDLRETDASDKLRFPGVKLMLDGSIQEFTALLNWPGYYKGPNDRGHAQMTDDELVAWMTPLQEAGIQVSGHCNGDATVDQFLDAVERVSTIAPSADIRHVAQHSQLTTPAQYERMATLGVGANIFANHLWYWGDQHYEITVGPARAEQMEACRTALSHDVPFSLHTDAPVTPLGCLHSMWCAVNRLTPSGRVLGEIEKLTPEQALRAVTLGSAYLLGLEQELGSIEPGKRADFTVLEESPLDVDPMDIRDIRVWGTILDGVKQPAAQT